MPHFHFPMPLALTLASLILPISSANGGTLTDKGKTLDRVDKALGKVPFSEAFEPGDEVQILRRSCNELAPDGACLACTGPEITTLTVLKREPDRAIIKSVAPGRKPVKVAFSKKRYDAVRGNYLRYLLERSSDLPGSRVDLIGLEASQSTIKLNGEEQAVPTGKVSAVLHRHSRKLDLTFSKPVIYTVTTGLPFFAQVIRIEKGNCPESPIHEIVEVYRN